MFISFPRFGMFSATIALNMFAVPFSFSCLPGIPIMWILFLLIVSRKSCRLSSLFFILFSFCSSDWVISNVLSSRSLILSSAWLSLFLKLSIESFSSVIVFFSSRSSVQVFLMVSISLLSFSFCSCVIFLILFSCLSECSCSSLNFFQRIVLNSLSDCSQRVSH